MTEEKTNVMRLLDQRKIPYTPHSYDVSDGALDGLTAASRLGIPPETCFKTLVTVGASKKNHVFVIPVERELDLKAAAKAVGEKAVEMLKQAQLLPLTGYVHGGCSPIGMKRRFPTVIDASAESLPQITVSAGRIGRQITVSPQALADYVGASFGEVSRS
ncbi:MAG: Cys-tRNA(Pro) deacylase [Oscillospiraceae bacterium]|jgi:Cys-tRNA(Pro)/Cys-tRNA(Cys) deacylase|nr:Cys-tRNA(Pro) deacylase [Oscillospiraceae bacterium]